MMAYVYGLFIIPAILSIIAFLVYIIALMKTRQLKDITDDDMFSLGPMLSIVGLVFVVVFILIFVVIIAIALFTMPITISKNFPVFHLAQETMYIYVGISLLFVMIPIGLGATLLIIGLILLAIGFWRFGEANNSTIIQVGAILMIILGNIGTLILGIALRDLAFKGRSSLANEALLNMVKDYLDKQAPRGFGIDVRQVGAQYGIPGYLMLQLVRHWVTVGELQGVLNNYYYISQKKE